MQTLVLCVHIIAMSLSLLLTAGAIVLGFMKKSRSLIIIKLAGVCTVIGGLSGAVLLAFAPVASQCVVLSLYLVGFGLLYKYAFGSGHAEHSPFLR